MAWKIESPWSDFCWDISWNRNYSALSLLKYCGTKLKERHTTVMSKTTNATSTWLSHLLLSEVWKSSLAIEPQIDLTGFHWDVEFKKKRNLLKQNYRVLVAASKQFWAQDSNSTCKHNAHKKTTVFLDELSAVYLKRFQREGNQLIFPGKKVVFRLLSSPLFLWERWKSAQSLSNPHSAVQYSRGMFGLSLPWSVYRT